MTLVAYGREGYGEIVERCCDVASRLGDRIDHHPAFRLLAPVRLNGVCFSLVDDTGEDLSSREVAAFLDRLRASGEAFMTPTTFQGVPAVRISVTNWRTTRNDADRTWRAMEQALEA